MEILHIGFNFDFSQKSEVMASVNLYSYKRGENTAEWLLLFVDGTPRVQHISPTTLCLIDYLALKGI